MKHCNIYICLFVVALLSACSNTKYLDKGQLLYTGAEINIIGDTITKDAKKNLEDDFKEQITPNPNSTFLGLRPKLWFYNIAGEPKKDKGFRYWLRNKFGEEPVLLTDVDQEFNRNLIENIAENQGYFNVRARYDTIRNGKKVKVAYQVTPNAQYIIDRVSFPTDTNALAKEINNTKEASLLKVGTPFNLDVIKAERERIDNQLKERGFYYFDPDHLIIQVDSTVSKHKVDLLVRVKKDIPDLAKHPYTTDRILVFSDYSLREPRNLNDTLRRRNRFLRGRNTVDTQSDTQKSDYLIIDPQKKFKPQIYDRALYFKKGDLYNRTNHNLSLNRLITLGPFKYVKNQFVLRDTLNRKFNVMYMLTPNPFKSLRLEVLGKTNSASFVGGELNVNWRHRNFLKGAELFTASVYTSTDFQLGKENTNNIYRLGGNVSLVWPRLVAPFHFSSSSGFVPKTRLRLGYEYHQRSDSYTLHNFNTSFGYLWKESARKEHELNVLEVTYVSPQSITASYEEEMQNNTALQRVVEKQLIFGPTYRYTFTNTLTPKKHTVYYNGMLDLSANLTGLFTGANVDKGNEKTVFGVPFSQYAKTEHTFTYYLQLTDKTQLATRAIAGFAYPYGNSAYMPFSKQFYVGGVNSIRAFRARNLGPGSYDGGVDENSRRNRFYEQAGDVKLELNVEYRANLVGFLNAAVFLDAGNVWLINDNPDIPGGKIGKDFLSELAVGAGVGLRFDFNIVLLRTDLAFPIRTPYFEKENRWNFKNIDFGDKTWRKDNLILNIAIGYPF